MRPSLTDQPRRLQPDRRHMPAERGEGEAWKLAQGSIKVAALAFFNAYTQTKSII